jgi:hypothetical protein
MTGRETMPTLTGDIKESIVKRRACFDGHLRGWALKAHFDSEIARPRFRAEVAAIGISHEARATRTGRRHCARMQTTRGRGPDADKVERRARPMLRCIADRTQTKGQKSAPEFRRKSLKGFAFPGFAIAGRPRCRIDPDSASAARPSALSPRAEPRPDPDRKNLSGAAPLLASRALARQSAGPPLWPIGPDGAGAGFFLPIFGSSPLSRRAMFS